MTSSPDMLTAVLKMVAALVVVVALAGGLMLAARRLLPSLGSRRAVLIRVLETRPLGPRKSIVLVQVPGAVLVVGVGSGAPTLLARLDAADLPEDRRGGGAHPPGPAFEQVLGRLMGRGRTRPTQTGGKEPGGDTVG